MPPNSKKPITFYLPEAELPEDATVAHMVGTHPDRGGNWLELLLFRTHQVAFAPSPCGKQLLQQRYPQVIQWSLTEDRLIKPLLSPLPTQK